MSSPDSFESGPFNIDDALRRAAEEISDTDAVIVHQVVKCLNETSKLMPYISRLKEIARNPEHRLFIPKNSDMSPEMKGHMSLMRQAQVGGIIHVLNVMHKTSMKTASQAPAIEKEAQKSAVDRALGNLGIDI